jgi:hypothetical protein
MAPIGMVRVAMQLLLLPFENNCVKADPIEDRSRILRVSDDIDLTLLKNACKAHNTTITVGVYSVVGQALKEYAR